MYKSLRQKTTAPPLSAGFIIMSCLFFKDEIAIRSSLEMFEYFNGLGTKYGSSSLRV